MEPLTRLTRTATVVLCVVAAACGGGGDDDGVRIADAWARPSPPGVTTGAVYLTLRSDDGDVLVGAVVDPVVAAAVELHTTCSAGGTSTMDPLGDLALPPGEDVTFAPGGNHIMLVDLAVPLVAGESFPLTLQLAELGPQTVDVAVGDGPP